MQKAKLERSRKQQKTLQLLIEQDNNNHHNLHDFL